MIVSRRQSSLLHLVGGLLAVLILVALPTFLGLAAPDTLNASGCAGDPSAAALRSIDQALQGSRSGVVPAPESTLDAVLGPNSLRTDQNRAATSTVAGLPESRPTPVETRTVLTL